MFIISILLTLISCQKDLTISSNVKAVAITTPAIDTGKFSSNKENTQPVALFDADLNTYGNLFAYQKISGAAYSAMVINPGRITVTNDPVFGNKRKVMLMDVRPTDNGGLTDNPRAQVQTPMNYTEGQSVYVGFSVRFTSKIWTYFLTFSEFYGAPYRGTSPFRLSIQADNIVASVTGDGKQYNLWKSPMEVNEWYDFVYHEVLSKGAKNGVVEVWLRKQGEQDFSKIVPLTPIATLTSANNIGPNYQKLACYYDKNNTFTDGSKANHVSSVKVFFTNHKVGDSFDAVAPLLLSE